MNNQQIKQPNQNDLYYTYDPFKKRFLSDNGIKYIFKNTHYKTNKTFWVYMKGEELTNALNKWYDELKVKQSIK